MTDVPPGELSHTADLLSAVRIQLSSVILGQDAVIEQVMITLLCGGHALLEGVPGVAKTLTIRCWPRRFHAA